jgi:hypothetical protein
MPALQVQKFIRVPQHPSLLSNPSIVEGSNSNSSHTYQGENDEEASIAGNFRRNPGNGSFLS